MCLAALLGLAVSSVSALAEADPDPDPDSKPQPPPEALLFEHRSAKPEPFLDRLASALFGTRYLFSSHPNPKGHWRDCNILESLSWLRT